MRLATRVLVVLAALMVLGGGAWARDHYLCSMSGRIASSCCCGSAHGPSTERSEPGVRPDDCCARVSPSERSSMATPRAGVQPSELAALVATVPEPAYFPPLPAARELIAHPGRGPPLPKQPLYVVHCAYLC